MGQVTLMTRYLDTHSLYVFLSIRFMSVNVHATDQLLKNMYRRYSRQQKARTHRYLRKDAHAIHEAPKSDI